MIGCGFIDVWESRGACQGIILDMVVSWMLYGNVSIQVRCDLMVGLWYGWCDLGVEWGWSGEGVGRGFVGVGGVWEGLVQLDWIGGDACGGRAGGVGVEKRVVRG